MTASLFPPQSGSGTTSITTSSPLSGAGTIGSPATIANGAIGLAKLANLATQTVIGRNSAGTGVPEAVTMAQLAVELNGGLYRSPLIDFTATSSGNIIAAAVAGKYANALVGNIVFTVAAGVCTVAPAGFYSASGAGTGIAADLCSIAQVNAVIASGVPARATTGLFTAAARQVTVNTAFTMDITTGAAGTGGFALSGYLYYVVFYL